MAGRWGLSPHGEWQDAKAFAGAGAPLVGYRSSDRHAPLIHGSNYHFESDEALVSLAMIETREALSNVEAICATEGLTGFMSGHLVWLRLWDINRT